MFCRQCGAQVDDGDRFCPSCGAPAEGETGEPSGEKLPGVPNETIEPEQKPKMNGKAVTSLVLGILSIPGAYIFVPGLVCGIIGIVLAVNAIKQVKESGGRGKGLAVAGLICAIVGTAAAGLWVVCCTFILKSIHDQGIQCGCILTGYLFHP
jgi:hypothetical protein